MLVKTMVSSDNCDMDSERSISVVLRIIDETQKLNPSGEPFMLDSRKLSHIDDAAAIVKKLEFDYKAITVLAKPVIDDSEYDINYGFVNTDLLNQQISYRLVIGKKYTDTVSELLINSLDDAQVKISVVMPANDVVLMTDRGTKKLATLKTGSGAYNFMKFMTGHPDVYIRLLKIQKEVEGCEERTDLTELVRNCGFKPPLKGCFFPNTTATRVIFRSQATISREIVSQLLF